MKTKNLSVVQYLLFSFFVIFLTPLAWTNHTDSPEIVTLVGDLQDELGCAGDWQPACDATGLTANGNVWEATFFLPAGNYQYKVALNDDWEENYGAGGVANGDTISLILPDGANVTFVYDHDTHMISENVPVVQPESVTIAGSLQSELGCLNDWDTSCSDTFLNFDNEDGIWQGVFNVPVGNWAYKAALNGSWDENYGANAQRNGADISLDLNAATDVKFYYDHVSHWITSNQNTVIAVVVGSFQEELGCSGDWQPWCLRSWLQDPDGDGIYSFATRDIPAGNYAVKVAHNESWDENYGQGGAQNGADIPFSVPNDGDLVVFSYDSLSHILDIGGELPPGNISEAKAYWLAEDTLAWNAPADSSVSLHYSADASLTITAGGLTGGDSLVLTRDGVVEGAIADKFRHLAGLPVFRIDPSQLTLVPAILKGQFVLGAADTSGNLIDATGVQSAGVLDDMYTYQGELGVIFHHRTPTIRVWAPTAKSVKLHLFDDTDNSQPAVSVMDMLEDPVTGTWTLAGNKAWSGKYYLFEVQVYARWAGAVITNLVTDPYSVSLSRDSKRSQIVNLHSQKLKPKNWDKLKKPWLKAPEDIAVYELHVRDFSISDETVPEWMRGTFKAFSRNSSNGIKHLRSLAKAGLTHIHLLPSFDCATIPEDRASQAIPEDFSLFGPDSEEQQAAIEAIRDEDGFNWCYDPFHYTTPEGSYSTDPDGPQRIREFREMVAGLNKLGLRVVMDVVYNHTSSSLQGEKSVLDKIVPDYYHRLNSSGGIETSSCCANTATEHNMMEKLMLDSLHTWATAYKVDGFRFDLMGHHTKVNIEKARDMLQALNKKRDGVDGKAIYLYGEGWNFGEVANNVRFEQATQANMGNNTGVGSFNDRMRDGLRGGGPFDSGQSHIQRQGFINGLFYDPNEMNSGATGEREELLQLTDWIRIGLSGSIKDFEFIDRFGNLIKSRDIDYSGNPGAGYTSDPQEVINYVAAHDNETLFDISQYKLPLDTSMDDRIRVLNLANSIVSLSQGVPLFHAGQDMARSKSMDRNSYNSGDWFNLLDFSYQQNGWGRGLPPFGDNQASWDEIQPLLANPDLGDLNKKDIRAANKHVREMLRIRNSSRLFRLRTGADVIAKVAFHNTGPEQIPGVVVMSLSDDDQVEIVVIFNASTEQKSVSLATIQSNEAEFELHRILRDSHDMIVRKASFNNDQQTFTVPARTTAVFVADD